MSTICVSPRHTQKPSDDTIRAMFEHNPDGAGFMYARCRIVHIRKGFMNIDDYMDAIHAEHFTQRDAVVYHFSGASSAGRLTPELTQPFPLSGELADMQLLDAACKCGVACGGFVMLNQSLTSPEYSDPVKFITQHLSQIIYGPAALKKPLILQGIYQLTHSKFAIMDVNGRIATVGEFIKVGGNYYSDDSYKPCEAQYREERPSASESSWPALPRLLNRVGLHSQRS